MAGCCNMPATKVFLIFHTLLGLSFWACAAGMIFLAVEIFYCIAPISSIFNDVYGALIGLSIVLILVGLIGYISAYKENRCLQITFFTLLFLIVITEIIGAIVSIVYKDEVNAAIKTDMNDAIQRYNEYDMSYQPQIGLDYMQQTFKCCGVSAYDDWFDTRFGRWNVGSVPRSCCIIQDYRCTGETTSHWDLDRIYQIGCHKVLYEYVKTYLSWMIVVLIQATGLVRTYIHIWGKHREYKVLESSRPDTSGHRANKETSA